MSAHGRDSVQSTASLDVNGVKNAVNGEQNAVNGDFCCSQRRLFSHFQSFCVLLHQNTHGKTQTKVSFDSLCKSSTNCIHDSIVKYAKKSVWMSYCVAENFVHHYFSKI